MLNFTSDEEEEVRKWKQRVQQQDVRITTLNAEALKKDKAMDNLNTENNDLKRRLDEGVDAACSLEDSLKKANEEKDNCKMANDNLQKRVDELEIELHGKNKNTRLESIDQDRASQMLLRDVENKLEEERSKRVKLEKQISEIQNTSVIPSLQYGADRGRNSVGMEAKIMALEKENASLKAEAARQEELTSNLASPSSLAVAKRMRRPRSSSASNGSDMDTQQLRDQINESNTKLNQLEAKLAKAEKEKNKAYNEQIAAGKASTATIEALRESVTEMKDELQFQKENIIGTLEKENTDLKSQCSRIPILEHELKTCRSDCSTIQSKLDTRDEEVGKLQREIKVYTSQIASAIEENAGLKKDLSAAGEVAKRLQQKEKEVESARRRTTKLSASIRRMLRGLGDRSINVGDETNQATGINGVGNESSLYNITISQGFEADLIDELEQLLSSIDEADRCVEFAKVERVMQARNAQAEVDEMGRKVEESERMIESLKGELHKSITDLNDAQKSLSLLQEEKENVEATYTEEETKRIEVEAKVEYLDNQLSLSESSIERCQSELTANQKECRSLEEKLSDLEDASREKTEHLQAEIEHLNSDNAAIKDELEVVLVKVASMSEEANENLNRCERLSNVIKEKEKEMEMLEGKLHNAKEELEGARLSKTMLSIREATLASDLHALQIELQERLQAASRREVEILSQGLESLQLEREQWENLLHEAHLQLDVMTSRVAISEEEKRAEKEQVARQVKSLNEEHIKTKGLLDCALKNFEMVKLDLQESRMNRQLAEDALVRLYPNAKETDVTVLGDFSCADMTQLHHTDGITASKDWENRLKVATEETAAATKEALHWKEESQSQGAALQREMASLLECTDRVQQLQQQLEQSERLQRIAQTSMQQMQEELNARMISSQKMQLSLQTSEEALIGLQKTSREADDEKEQLKEQHERSRQNDANQIKDLTRELETVKQECFMLKTEVDNLIQASADLQLHYDQAIASRNSAESKCASLEFTCEEYEKVQGENEKRVSSLQEVMISHQEELKKRAEQTLALEEELQDAKKGYETLKSQMEARNVEYWETKEELAEWQERYERSQADVKIKDDLEESLKEGENRIEKMSAELDNLKERCTVCDEQIDILRKEKKESFSRLTALTEELHESRKLAAALSECQQQLSDSVALIEQLEYDLAQKAQECEDADDKELALRKDNKRLAARLAAVQVRIEKLQQASQVSTSHSATSLNIARMTTPERKVEGDTHSSASRKRRAPEDEDAVIKEIEAPVLTRAIYAPKTINDAIPRTIGKSANNTHTQEAMKKTSQSPSDLIVKRLKSPQKVSLSDRTNLLQPRQQTNSTNKPNTDSQHFMAKLNRYRSPTTIPLQNQ